MISKFGMIKLNSDEKFAKWYSDPENQKYYLSLLRKYGGSSNNYYNYDGSLNKLDFSSINSENIIIGNNK